VKQLISTATTVIFNKRFKSTQPPVSENVVIGQQYQLKSSTASHKQLNNKTSIVIGTSYVTVLKKDILSNNEVDPNGWI
jgi:hypothetical protein